MVTVFVLSSLLGSGGLEELFFLFLAFFLSLGDLRFIQGLAGERVEGGCQFLTACKACADLHVILGFKINLIYFS